MNDLPACRFRAARQCCSNSFFCSHEKVRTPGRQVDELICGHCEFCHAGEPASGEPTETAAGVSMPGMASRIWNAAHAVGAFVSDGLQLVSRDEYQKRLSTCEACEFRSGSICSKCGCFIELKARGRAFECPDNRW